MINHPILDYLRQLNFISVLVRLALAVLLSGFVGFERERKGQPAGLRTHMLVCLGSALAILTNLFLSETQAFADPTRIAAQVVSGIGFLGAGAIVVTGRLQRQVKGLTTAAGLWGSACMGLALGAGFFEGAILACVLMVVIITVLHNLDERIHKNMRVLSIHAEFEDIESVRALARKVREIGCTLESSEIGKSDTGLNGISGFFVVRYPAKLLNKAKILEILQDLDGIIIIERV